MTNKVSVYRLSLEERPAGREHANKREASQTREKVPGSRRQCTRRPPKQATWHASAQAQSLFSCEGGLRMGNRLASAPAAQRPAGVTHAYAAGRSAAHATAGRSAAVRHMQAKPATKNHTTCRLSDKETTQSCFKIERDDAR